MQLRYQHALDSRGCDGRDGENTDEWVRRGRWTGRRGGGGHHALLSGAKNAAGTALVTYDDPVRRRAEGDDDGLRRTEEEETGRAAEEEGRGGRPSGPLPACCPITPNTIKLLLM